MIIFEFSNNVIDSIIKELRDAEKFIYIGLFQIHNASIFDTLQNKLNEGVRVRILTLPLDSVNEDIRERVSQDFGKLQQNGAEINYCKWNVGDPERTTTAGGSHWYSFHGKFIVTDKTAIALTANFTVNAEWDAIIFFRNDSNKINEFSQKFSKLLEIFITPHKQSDGRIRQMVEDVNPAHLKEVFRLPPKIPSKEHKDHWVMHYPSELCPTDVSIEDNLYLIPFDSRGRTFYESIINDASKYAYVICETFTDTEFSSFLIKSKLRGVDIKVLTGGKSQDFQNKVGIIMKGLLSQEIEVKTLGDILHAKMIVTEKHVVISSINLNKMNLGISQSAKYWRENTETLLVCSKGEIVKQATEKFLDVFTKAGLIEDTLAKSLVKDFQSIISKNFNLRTEHEFKYLFAKFILNREIEIKKTTMEICKITANLMKILNRNNGKEKKTVGKEEFFLALILFHLTERKNEEIDLQEKLNTLGVEFDLKKLLNILTTNELIEKSDSYYKIKLTSLLKNA